MKSAESARTRARQRQGASRVPRSARFADLATLSLAALGVVCGDIGTSPLYAVKACFAKPYGVDVSPENVLGVTSLFFWSLTLVIAIKYLVFVMRADNHGEGGVMALITLVSRFRRRRRGARMATALAALGILGAALFFGDSMITPAISVLSAVEGLKIVNPQLAEWVVPITAVIIIGLFASFERSG
mgnify:CR=1 FL=1